MMTAPKPETAEPIIDTFLEDLFDAVNVDGLDESDWAHARHRLAQRDATRDELIRAEGRERIAELEAYDELRRHRVSVGLAQQGLHMARAACEALGLDFEDTAPVDIAERIASLEAQLATAREENAAWQAKAKSIADSLQEYVDTVSKQLATAREAVLKEAMAAIEALDIVQGRKNEYEVGQQRGLDVALDAVEALLTSPPPRVDGWIPVGPDSPPRKQGDVLLYVHGMVVHGHSAAIDEATHWQPLPAPPSQPDAGTEETP
jgi:hypothetical protein